MSVAAEAGELLEPFMWLTPEQSMQPDTDTREQICDEIGDVLICLVNLSARLGIDPLEAACRKMTKNRQKYPVESSRGNATKYDRFNK